VLTRVTTGALLGAIAVEVDCAELDPAQAGCLAKLWRQTWCPGAVVAVLTNGKWNHPDFGVRILELLVDKDFAAQTVWVEREAGAHQWAGGQVWWVLDATKLLGDSKAATLSAVQQLPGTPELAEVVVRDPAADLLRAGSLDEIATGTGADACWLYVQADLVDLAVKVCAKCVTRWGVRVLERQEQPSG